MNLRHQGLFSTSHPVRRPSATDGIIFSQVERQEIKKRKPPRLQPAQPIVSPQVVEASQPIPQTVMAAESVTKTNPTPVEPEYRYIRFVRRAEINWSDGEYGNNTRWHVAPDS
jgi:hypothetical protein